jgi:hypothetical protein
MPKSEQSFYETEKRGDDGTAPIVHPSICRWLVLMSADATAASFLKAVSARERGGGFNPLAIRASIAFAVLAA